MSKSEEELDPKYQALLARIQKKIASDPERYLPKRFAAPQLVEVGQVRVCVQHQTPAEARTVIVCEVNGGVSTVAITALVDEWTRPGSVIFKGPDKKLLAAMPNTMATVFTSQLVDTPVFTKVSEDVVEQVARNMYHMFEAPLLNIMQQELPERTWEDVTNYWNGEIEAIGALANDCFWELVE